MVSLYLVLVSFHEGSPETHPFVLSILYISACADSNAERVMIYEILVRRNKNKVRRCLPSTPSG